MDANMTHSTNRNNIEPMLFSVAGVMVLLCLFTTRAVERFHVRQFAGDYRTVNSFFCRPAFREFAGVFGVGGFGTYFTFWSLPVFARMCDQSPPAHLGRVKFAEVKSLMRAFAILALPVNPIFGCAIFVKIRHLLSSLAFRACFCYDWFRHGFFLSKKLCSEPLQAQYLCGSLYCSTSRGVVK